MRCSSTGSSSGSTGSPGGSTGSTVVVVLVVLVAVLVVLVVVLVALAIVLVALVVVLLVLVQGGGQAVCVGFAAAPTTTATAAPRISVLLSVAESCGGRGSRVSTT